MKSLFRIALAFVASITLAADNDVALSKYSTDKTGIVKMRTTDTAGVHVQHVIIDSGGGGGGAMTVADGADVALGSTTDAATTGPGSLNAHARSAAVNLGAITLQLPASLGIKTAAGSLSMAPASDATFAVSQSGTWNLVNISGTITLPTGASTAANQSTGNTSLASIATNTTGLATAANQATSATTLSTIATNTTGASTAANQTTGNTSLATIATNTPALGAAAASASRPVIGAFETATGSLTATGTVATVNCKGQGSITAQVTVGVATWVAEGTIDGSTWIALSQCFNIGSLSQVDFTTGAFSGSKNIYVANYGFTQIRVRCVIYTSGTITATMATATVAPFQGLLPAVGVNNWSEGGSLSPATLSIGGGFDRQLAVTPVLDDGAGSRRQRTISIIKTASATASGNTSLWAATSAKKHRIMALMVALTQDAATAGGADIVIDIQDVTTSTNLTFTVFVPAVAATTIGSGFSTGWIKLDNGILQTTANTAINVNLSAALTSGACRVVIAGTDE